MSPLKKAGIFLFVRRGVLFEILHPYDIIIKRKEGMVPFSEFKKLEIKIATIKEVSNHPNADKLYVIKIDVGGIEKTIVAGIKSGYAPEQLINRCIVVVDNLEPAVIRGVESQAMLLAASDDKGISILIPDREVKTGSLVK